MRGPARAPALALLLGLLAGVPGQGRGAATADEITLTDGRTLRGHATAAGDTTRINTFGCSVAEMTLGVVEVPTGTVREVEPWPEEDVLVRGRDEVIETDVPRRVALLEFALATRQRDWVERLALETLALDAAQPVAVKALGRRAPEAAALRADLRLAPDLRRAVRALLRLPDGASRRRAAEEVGRREGATLDGTFIERCAAVLEAERGVLPDLVATWPAAPEDRGRYSLFVPERIDPLDPRPLVVALHGGGSDPNDPAVVRGSGKELLPVLVEEARRRGWILLCPTALEAPWATARNARWIESLLGEVGARWHVDRERVHLVGLSDGGDGAWTHGVREADRHASVGVASGGKPPGLGALTAKGCAVWIYHGERDDVVPVAPVRAAAERLRRSKADLVYCELPREGHGWPPAAVRDWAETIAPKRRRRAASAFPRSSFEEPVSGMERERWGHPAASWQAEAFAAMDPETLWGHVVSGRTEAEPAARALEAQGVGAAGAPWRERARQLAADRDAPVGAVREALWLLGRWRDGEAVGVLGDLLRTRGEATLIEAAAAALGRLAGVDATQDLRFALRALDRRWKGRGTGRVPFGAFEATVGAGRALVEAAGRTRAQGDLLAELEEVLVVGVLRDGRGLDADPSVGEEPEPLRRGLMEALARTYRDCRGPPTLVDMLRHVAGRDPLARAAIDRGAAEGWR